MTAAEIIAELMKFPPHYEGYWRIWINGRHYAAHRLAWLFVYGKWPDGEVDHIDGAKNNNRIKNLRVTTKAGNQQNQRKARKDNKSGLLGVYWRPDTEKWRATIQTNKKRISLGNFDSADLAYEAYIKAKRRLHSTCTI